LMLHQGFFSL